MKQRTGLMNLFWTLMAVLIVGVTVLGGCIAWKLIHSTTPKIERSHVDPEQLLERTLAARQEEISDTTTADTTNTEEKTGVQPATKSESFTSSQNNEEDTFWEDDEDYYDEEEDEETDEEQSNEFSYTLEDVPTTAKPSKSVAKPKASATRVAPKIIYASYQEGLLQCQKGHVIPCSWKDNSGPLVKQYWLRSYQGPIERIIYTRDGKIISQTFASVGGAVTRYQGSFAELYFEDGLLTKIRTFPYDNPNLRDWFLIDKKGKISACLCGIPTKDCCARSSLYREGGPRRYCDLFPLDPDFCSK